MTENFSHSNKNQSFSRIIDADKITEITGIAKDNFPKLRQFARRVGPFPGLDTMITINFSPIRHVELGQGIVKKAWAPLYQPVFTSTKVSMAGYCQRHRIRDIVYRTQLAFVCCKGING